MDMFSVDSALRGGQWESKSQLLDYLKQQQLASLFYNYRGECMCVLLPGDPGRAFKYAILHVENGIRLRYRKLERLSTTYPSHGVSPSKLLSEATGKSKLD